MPKCTFCQKEVEVQDRVGRCDVCPHCSRDLHCCLQCRFYDPAAYHQCCETQADWVSDKEQANFCDYFNFNPQAQIQKKAAVTSATKVDDVKTQWENLFKKK